MHDDLNGERGSGGNSPSKHKDILYLDICIYWGEINQKQC